MIFLPLFGRYHQPWQAIDILYFTCICYSLWPQSLLIHLCKSFIQSLDNKISLVIINPEVDHIIFSLNVFIVMFIYIQLYTRMHMKAF